jgi:hypothetical protein
MNTIFLVIGWTMLICGIIAVTGFLYQLGRLILDGARHAPYRD